MYVYDKKVREYHQQQKLEFLQQVIRRNNEKAFASSLLTRRMREKYKPHRYKFGKNVYYIFRADRIPADIGARVRLTPAEHVYTGAMT